MVVMPPPSMVVSALMVFVLVTTIVAVSPQSKVTAPSKLAPPGRQASNGASVQLAPVPVPTTHARQEDAAARMDNTPATATGRSITTDSPNPILVRPWRYNWV